MLAYFQRASSLGQGLLPEQLARPATAYGRAELERKLRRENFSSFPVDVLQRFETQLANKLTETMRSCLEFDLGAFEAAFRSVFQLRDELSRDAIQHEFIGQDGGARLIALLQGYPALARLWSQLISNWVARISELVARLTADKRAIRQTFFRGCNPGDLVDVSTGLSDPHHSGRETIIISFRNGRVVYKPRSGRSESDWFSFLDWSNRQRFAPRFRTLSLLRRRDYCWMEFVEHLPCCSGADAHRYYRRAGGLTCAAYLLGAIDCHRDNLIAAGDQPVLIDAETFLHYQTAAALREQNGSVTRTGLLPIPASLSGARADIGAFGGTPGIHTPTLRGVHLAASSYPDDVARGFRDMWNLIGKPYTQTGAAFRRRMRRLAQRSWRRIPRSTRTYSEIRSRSLGSEALRSGLQRSRGIAFDLLRSSLDASFVFEEVRAISRLDIPYFLALPGKKLPATNSLPLPALLACVRSVLDSD